MHQNRENTTYKVLHRVKHYIWLSICNICGQIIFDGFGTVMFYLLGRGKVFGKENLPHGSFILASNHVSYADFVILHAIFRLKFRREITFIAKKKLFHHYWWKMAMTYNKCIYLDQDKPSKDMLKASMKLLHTTNNILGIFPEGKRSENGKLINGNDGVVKISLIANSPIVPVGLNGFYEMWPRNKRLPQRSKLSINIGKAVYLTKDARDDVSGMTKKLMCEIAKLTGQEYNF